MARSTLVIPIKEIGPQGLHVERVFDRAGVKHLLAETPFVEENQATKARVALTLTGSGTTVFVQGHLEGRIGVTCSRCLNTAQVVLPEDTFYMTYLSPDEVNHMEAEVELTPDDLDTMVHDGQTIDLESLIREQLVLAVPIAPLCQQDCKGLCQSCGKNLNQEACVCDEGPEADSDWKQSLEKLKASLPQT